MHALNSLELWRQRRADLMREVENQRLAYRLRTASRGKSAPPGYPGESRAMRVAGRAA